MLTIIDILKASIKDRKVPEEGDLRRLPYKRCFIYGRVSTPGQVRDSRESIREIGRLVELAIKDGYPYSKARTPNLRIHYQMYTEKLTYFPILLFVESGLPRKKVQDSV